MSRMSGPKRKRVYEILVRRDGEYCFIGGERGNTTSLIIDHWDNDNNNIAFENLHLLCRSMNSVKNPRGRDHRHKLLSSACVSANSSQEIIDGSQLRIQSMELAINQKAEPAFRHWLFANIARTGIVPMQEAIDAGSEVAHVSLETIKRYLRKVTSSVSIYNLAREEASGRMIICLKPEWDTFRKREEELRKLDEQVKNWQEP